MIYIVSLTKHFLLLTIRDRQDTGSGQGLLKPRLEIGTGSLLLHSIGQSKSQGLFRFRGEAMDSTY